MDDTSRGRGRSVAIRAHALAAIACASACASAPDKGPGSEPDIRNPGPDFGYIPNSIGIVQPGRAYLESAAELGGGGAGEAEVLRVPVLARVGVAEDWEARVQVWALQHVEVASSGTTGSGPVQIGFKHRVSQGEGRFLAPAWGFEVELLLPLSSGDLDDGKVEPQAWLNFDHYVTQGGLFTWNGGVRAPVDDAGSQYAQAYLALAYSQFVAPDLQLYGTGSWNQAAPDGTGSDSQAGAGLYWYLTRRAVLLAGYNAGLTSMSPDLATLGLSIGF